MQHAALRPGFFALLLVAGAVLFTACGPASERLDRRDERDPLIIRGDTRKRAGDLDGAIEMYQQALDRKPQLALAHLKLGVEYDEYKRDYLRAIYHYSRYLELRPRAQKNELVEELIRMAHISYLASLPNPPPGAIERIAMIERENERLRRQIDDLAARLRNAPAAVQADPRTGQPAVTPPPPAAAATASPARPQPEPAPAARPPRTYRVERGDTLSRIAGKVYNDHSQWRKIYEANRNALPSPESVQEGQVLIIP